MKKNGKQKDHPEIIDIKNICDITPETSITKDVCEKVNKAKINGSKAKNASKKP